MEEAKTCRRCGETKPLTAYYVNRKCQQGRSPWCKVCAGVYAASRRKSRGTTLRGVQRGSNGELLAETLTARRDDYISMLSAAVDRWREADDPEDRAGAKDAVLFRCRQLVEAEGLVVT
jgi:hypothetical protein